MRLRLDNLHPLGVIRHFQRMTMAARSVDAVATGKQQSVTCLRGDELITLLDRSIPARGFVITLEIFVNLAELKIDSVWVAVTKC